MAWQSTARPTGSHGPNAHLGDELRMKSEIKDLTRRVNQIGARQWNQSQEEIIVGFLNQLPQELHDAVLEYIRHQAKLEQEGNMN